jgi:hypothetical protein
MKIMIILIDQGKKETKYERKANPIDPGNGVKLDGKMFVSYGLRSVFQKS